MSKTWKYEKTKWGEYVKKDGSTFKHSRVKQNELDETLAKRAHLEAWLGDCPDEVH